MTRTVAIVQARMGSTRLPGKVLLELQGQPVLLWVVRRLRRARNLSEVAVATTMLPADDALEAFCALHGIPCIRGSEHDVTARYIRAATTLQAETVVRVTADCPLIDPTLVDQVLDAFHRERADYASNVHPQRTFPRGLDVEVLSRACLARLDREDRDPASREHVTLHLRRRPEGYRIASLEGREDLSHMRWTLDTPEDLTFLRALLERSSAGDAVTTEQLLEILRRDPRLLEINRDVVQKAG